MEYIFEPRPRDKTIETTTGNLIMARLLEPYKAGKFMTAIAGYSDSELAKILVTSSLLYKRYLQTHWNMN